MMLRLKLAGIIGAFGMMIGSVPAILYASTVYGLVFGAVLGWIVGFLFGFGIGGALTHSTAVSQAERLFVGLRKIDIVFACVLVAAGIATLIVGGWNVSVFLATAFFAVCSLYLIYRHMGENRN